MSDVSVIVEGVEFTGWQGVEITRSIETLVATATLDLTDRWTQESAPKPICEFDNCLVEVDGETLITGYVNSVAPAHDASSISVSMAVRSDTGILAKSAADFETGELRGQSLLDTARKLTETWGIQVRAISSHAVTPFDRIEIEPGETVAELLERLARQRGLYLTDAPDGSLWIMRPEAGAVQALLEFGGAGNMRSCAAVFDGSDQYSDVIVKGQREGSDSWTTEAAAAPMGHARDASVRLPSHLVLISETQGDSAALQQRATYEVGLRRGRARQWTVVVSGWRTEAGKLWEAGKGVEITDRWAGLDRDRLLVVSTTFQYDDREGERTQLVLGLPEGYELRGEPETKKESAGW